MDLLNQRILFRDRFHDYKDDSLPTMPVRFALPTIAYHVRVNTIVQKRNFLQETIIFLKGKKMTKTAIAETLCLDAKLVDIIIDNYKKSINDDSSDSRSNIEVTKESNDFYIFYDLISHQFIEGYIDADVFYENTYSMNMESYNRSDHCYYLKENIGKSIAKKIHLLSNEKYDFTSIIEPSSQDIIECYKKERLFSAKEYKNPVYLGEHHQVWLALDYSVTPFNRNEFSIVNPFRTYISFSAYFTNIVKRLFTDNSSTRDIFEYQSNVKSVEINKQNRRMHLNSVADNAVYERLQKKYGKYSFFNDNSRYSDLISQLIKMQSAYDYIEKYYGKKDCTEKARNFYVYANNVLEKLFIATYSPFIFEIYDLLDKDGFFQKYRREKEDKAKRLVIEKYIQGIDSVNDFSIIMECVSPDIVVQTIQNRNILAEKSFKPGMKELFVINVLCASFLKDCKFHNLLSNSIDELGSTLSVILAERQQVSHSLLKPDDFVKDVIGVIYKIIDVMMEVSEEDEIELAADNNEDLESYMASYTDINNMSQILKESSNTLLLDIYNLNPLYYSDCVIAFENTSKIILDYVMRSLTSEDQLYDYLDKIPNKQDDAKLMLMEDLEDAGIDSDFVGVTVKIPKAKKCIKCNLEFMPASTLIVFAPLLLSVVDYTAFLKLFKSLGPDYFKDAINAINERGHNNLSTEWDQIKVINNRYLEYCRILTLFDREEL